MSKTRAQWEADHTRTHTPDPHLRVELPFEVMDGIIARHLGDRPKTTLSLPPLPGIGTVGTVAVSADSVRLRPAPPGMVGFEARVSLWDGRRRLMTVGLHARTAPVLDLRRGTLSFALTARDLHGIRPKLDPAGSRALARFVHEHLPAPAQALISTSDLDAMMDDVVGTVLREASSAGRDRLFSGLTLGTEFTVALPPAIPVASLAIRSEAAPSGRLVLDVTTTLPVQHGLEGEAVRPSQLHPNVVVVRMSGSTVAALGNMAMDRGLLPSHYRDDGSPDPSGPFTARLSWESHPRPLKLQVWQLEGRCVYAKLGTLPQLSLSGDTLTLKVTDARLETLDGPAALRAQAWFATTGRRTFSFVQEMATEVALETRSGPMTAKIHDVIRQDDDVIVGLVVTLP